MITHRNSLDICPGGVPLFIRLSQYDSSFTLIFDLFSHKGTFTVESGTTARFRELKPDGNAISIDATISGTTVTLAPSQANAQQMTAIAGNCKCELSLFKGDKELNTANFTLLIEKAVIDKDTPYSDSVIRELIDVTDRADEIMEAAETVDEAIADLPNLIDPTLTLEGHAADAKAVGDTIDSLDNSKIDKQQEVTDAGKALIVNADGIVLPTEFKAGLTDDAIDALLNCFAHVVWIDEHGQEYYDALEEALREEEPARHLAYKLSDNTAILYEGGVTTSPTYGMSIYSSNNTRKTVGVSEGVKPYVDKTTGTELIIYPFAIPEWAKSAQITLDPPTMYTDVSSRVYDPDSNKYSGGINSSGWLSSGSYVDFPAGVKYATLAVKYDSSGSAFPADPSDVKIEFFEDSAYVESYYNRALSDSVATLITGGVTVHDVNGISINTAFTRRRTFGIKNGVRPYVSYADGTDLSIYPIPVPADAKHVTLSITPNTMYFAPGFYTYDEAEKKYVVNGADPVWQENGSTIDVPEGSEYLTCNIKADASGSAFTTEPSAISIVFSQS